MPTQTFYTQWDGSKKQSNDSYIANADELTSLTKFAVQTAAVSVGAVAIELTASLATRRTILIQNNGSAAIFIGGASVTTSDGVKLDAGQMIEIAATNNVKIYGISAGTVNVRCLESG